LTKNKQRDKREEIDDLFSAAREKLEGWLASKPTGKYCLTVETNQGGIRSKEIKVTNKI